MIGEFINVDYRIPGLKHTVRIDCLIKMEDGRHFIIEIQNGHPEKMPLERILFEQSIFITNYLEKGEDYTNLPEVISLVYTTKPLEGLDDENALADLIVYNRRTKKEVPEFKIRSLIVNGKYKEKKFKDFSDILNDLQKKDIDKIDNPVFRSIHKDLKETEGDKKMYSDYVKKRYGKYIEGYEKLEKRVFELEQQHNKDQEKLNNLSERRILELENQHNEDQKRIKELERKLKDFESKSI